MRSLVDKKGYWYLFGFSASKGPLLELRVTGIVKKNKATPSKQILGSSFKRVLFKISYECIGALVHFIWEFTRALCIAGHHVMTSRDVNMETTSFL